MRSFPFFLVLVCLFLGCNDLQKDKQELQDPGWQVTPANLPKLVPLNAKARDAVLQWKEYQVFEISFERMYGIDFREDFVLVLEELIERQKQWEASTYPPKFDTPQIKGRQKVLKTYILKTKGNLEYREAPEQSIKEMITAFNALRGQFNSIVNNTLPEDLLKEENKNGGL